MMDIRADNPEIPTSTIYDWWKEFRIRNEAKDQNPEASDRPSLQVLQGNFARIQIEDDRSDISRIRNVLSDLAENDGIAPTVRVQSCQAWMKLIELLATGKISGDEALEQASIDLADLDSQELMQQFMAVKNVS